MGRRLNKKVTRRSWWRRQLDALDLKPGQRRKVEAAVRELLGADQPIALYRTTRRTCEACQRRCYEDGPAPDCTCEAEPEIVIDVGLREPDALYVWVQRDGYRSHWSVPRNISMRIWGLTKVYQFTERDRPVIRRQVSR